MSQQELSQQSGVGKSNISNALTGKTEPRPRTLRALANALRVPADLLTAADLGLEAFGDFSPPPPSSPIAINDEVSTDHDFEDADLAEHSGGPLRGAPP